MKPSHYHSNRCPYNWLVYDIGDAFLERFVNLYKGHLYDLGCGEMPYRKWFLDYVNIYTGVDWGGTQHKIKADILSDLNETLPIEGQSADTVISLSVMEHLREPQIFLNEAYRILKPGGAMILQVPFMWWVHESPHDYFRYTRYGLEYLFDMAGFKSVEIYPQTGFWVMWILKFNYQTARLICGPWPLRKLIGLLMRFVWAIDQRIAPLLDRCWKCEAETGGYFVVGKKL